MKKLLIVAGLGLLLIGLLVAFLPLNMPASERYFDLPPARQLQVDERGQLEHTKRTYQYLANTGDDFKDWDVGHQGFWKYTIAFSAYGIPSAMIIDPASADEYALLLDNMIWKMKSRKVWGDFTDRGFGPDPISVQNIMYKGHLNLMYALYQLSTGDTRYAREFTWLTQQIAEEMRMHHEGFYEGVTCEANAWFVECNTIGMLSLHIYDKLYGTQYTENEVQWSIDFIFDRMTDPATGLFYKSYHPNHDTVTRMVRGYNNAWILTFLNPLLPEKMAALYPAFKQHLTSELGPYATVRYEIDGPMDLTAHLFGLWAAKEFDDVALFAKFRNAIDKFGGLGTDTETGGMSYRIAESLLINGSVAAAKMHLGWAEVINHDWGHPYQRPYPRLTI